MAIAKFGVLVVAARGTLGGVVFTANQAGPYVKIWAPASNPQTVLQSLQRNTIVSFAQAWQSLTSGERTGWGTYAALPAQDLTNTLGETYSISGFNWFVRINSNLQQAGLPQRDIAPVTAIPGAPTITAAFLKTDDAPTESRIDIDGADSTREDIHVVTARVFNSEGRLSGFFNLANILTQVPDEPPAADLPLTMTASSTFAGDVQDLQDGDFTTGWSVGDPPPPQWIQGDLVTADRAPLTYRFRGFDGGDDTQLPTTWQFQFWTGSAWTAADIVSGYSPVFPDWNEFAIDDPDAAASDMFRMNVTATNGGTIWLMSGFEITGFDPDLEHCLRFQTELQARAGTVLMGQKVFYQVRVQNDHGRRGPPSSVTALAEES